ncbi:cytochrome P450 alkane hydroxylase-like protein [Lophiotrema nucula]|uniref:Cytochrome P450 alkane hydroxylase-like protein n=1 Tax=Lophiotrema nucula TaxID=690887 RepID=A0A6A5YW00_9PLEO|nr:cytochrome P450 alkane hydroxylase-like protein [Lophiotrema nucula]
MDVVKSPTGVAFSIFAVSVCLAVFFNTRQRRALETKNGCAPPPRFNNKEPITAIDYTYNLFTDVHNMFINHARYGKTFSVNPWIGPRSIVTADVENIKHVFQSKDWGNFWRREPFSPFTGIGLLTEDGAEWNDARKAVKPSFAKNNLSDLSYFSHVIDGLIEQIPADGQQIDMQPMFIKSFVDNALYFILGYDVNNPPEGIPSSRDQFLDSWGKAIEGTGLRLMLGGFRSLLPTGAYKRVCGQVHDFVAFCVERASIDTDNGSKNMAKTFLSLGRDKLWIRNHLVQGIIGAQDTTSILLSNTVYFLARSPAHWKFLREEALRQGDSMFEWDALRNNTVIQNMLFESLRLRPLFPALQRQAYVDTIIPTGGGPSGTSPIFVPAGSEFLPSFYVLHRDPAVFGPDVESFEPDRWNSIKPTQWEFMGFGGGPRSCLGKEKSLVEGAYVLAKLAGKFEKLEARDEKEWIGESKITCANKHGCKVAFFS